jgi:hypothetical protein
VSRYFKFKEKLPQKPYIFRRISTEENLEPKVAKNRYKLHQDPTTGPPKLVTGDMKQGLESQREV